MSLNKKFALVGSLVLSTVLSLAAHAGGCDGQLATDSAMDASMIKPIPAAAEAYWNTINIDKSDQIAGQRGKLMIVKNDAGQDMFNVDGGQYSASLHVLTQGLRLPQLFGTAAAPGPINEPQKWGPRDYALPFVDAGSTTPDLGGGISLLRTQVDILPFVAQFNYQLQMKTVGPAINAGKVTVAQSWFLNNMVEFKKSSGSKCSNFMDVNQGSWFLVQSRNGLYVRYNVTVRVSYATSVGLRDQLEGLVTKMLAAGCKKSGMADNCWAN